MDPVGTLLKASSSRTGKLETRACAWTCPPRVVFDDPARQDSNPQHDAAPSTRYRALQPATHQSTKTKEIRDDDDPGPDEPASTKTRDPQDDDDLCSQPGVPLYSFSSGVRKSPSEAISTLIGRTSWESCSLWPFQPSLAGVSWESRLL